MMKHFLFISLLLAFGPGAFSFQMPLGGVSQVRKENAALSSSLFRKPEMWSRPLLQMSSTDDSPTTVASKESSNEEGIGAWIPIASASALEGLGPQQVTVMGLDLVVWQGADNRWSVLGDVCPHRMAPLSQGRVDPKTNCIECPYHGWQFTTNGKLSTIPQLEEDRTISSIEKSNASNFPVHLAGDLIYAFLPSSVHGEMFEQSVLPEQMYPTVREDMARNVTYYVRELPYSSDFLIENFMDPAHIPFAHHKLQATRQDSGPIPMDTLVSNFTHVEVSFKDSSGQGKDKEREGVVSFQRPSVYHFRTRKKDGSFRTNLNIHVVPIRAGKTRVLFAGPFSNAWWLPTWVAHAGSNRFLNTDTWLHDAEIAVRAKSENSNAYVYASQSDNGVLEFRKWWAKNGFSKAPPNTYGPAPSESLTKMSRREQIDPWDHHSKQCSSCRKALNAMKRVKVGGWVVTVASAIFLRSWPLRAALVAGLGMYSTYFVTKAATVIEGNPYPSGVSDRSAAAEAD